MRRVAAAVAAGVVAAGLCAPVANATPAPPYVDHVEWAKWGDLSSLRVYPTAAGRQASGPAASTPAEAAWAEVLAQSPDADIPGMKPQFLCHWEYAELGYPGKTSWNLEPWRPEVPYQEMLEAGCNPGGTEEPF
ncbi:DUF2599 domain-containing protein [Mycolicibacterium flavescens]|uniref:DUF2599 domain-containing protein n=1 Tax=Mycolicibacterium flavescens TaxID=1776 RepID=A0A1E3RFV5_MYCFV|nr:DUF2599 domain-containing protein [Mycolicibacterium flavescens]MCV7282868.1 DUF2599 domain-containing protein [Mycolicibacterium flavescens]ODQ88766.1 hypothetical protein BHQ18_18115 [Mycolicibacterium flavescens]